jgi:hypothetical protein
LLSACSGGDGGASEIKLDGSPRFPDDEGVATVATRDEIVLDGERRYEVSEGLKSFSTQTLQTVALVQREGQYVQVGLDGKTVVWIAGIADVVPTKPPRVHYIGEVTEVRDGRAIFRDGTVLRLGQNVKITEGPATVLIDPKIGKIVEVRTGSVR